MKDFQFQLILYGIEFCKQKTTGPIVQKAGGFLFMRDV